MKIAVVGGGPGGLYFAIQMKALDPGHQVDLYERNDRGNTFGWGVVFSDETLDNFLSADPLSAEAIRATLHHWDDIEIRFKGERLRSSGHGFSGVGRHRLLAILEKRAEDLGVNLHFGSHVTAPSDLAGADLIVAADGIFSNTRNQLAEQFKPEIDWRKCKYTWLGTRRRFDAFTFAFQEHESGWFQAHCYQFDSETSTCIIECRDETWIKSGLHEMSRSDSLSFCEKLFGDLLEGHSLLSNSNHLRGSEAWLSFPRVHCERWHHENVVLLGDAAASAHFSIGSGTKLAMESAIALAKYVNEERDRERALDRYESERRIEVLKLQSAARNSTEWFENVDGKVSLEPQQFAYSLLTRSQRVSHENLRVRDRKYLESYEAWFARRCTTSAVTRRPPMFTPFELRSLTLENRIAVSPMDMYSAVDGVPGDFHLVHLGARALGGAALIFTEMTCISPEGRITPGCAGIYNDQQAEAWARIVDFIHGNSSAKIALQIGHSGRKGSTKVAWDGMDEPLDNGDWEIFAPSAIPYTDRNQIPTEMEKEHFSKVLADFVNAARRADKAGFDLLELHCAHGYLLSSFISPLTNLRTDEYGGDLEKRMRFPLEVFEAVRKVWPAEKPMSVRISACDWAEGGTTPEDAIRITQMFRDLGLDIIDVSAGQVVSQQRPIYGRMFQTPFSDQIRTALNFPTMAVGNIYEPDHVNSIIAAGRADLCLLARPHLANPNWTLHAAADLGFQEMEWPKQYESGKQQLYRLRDRQKEL